MARLWSWGRPTTFSSASSLIAELFRQTTASSGHRVLRSGSASGVASSGLNDWGARGTELINSNLGGGEDTHTHTHRGERNKGGRERECVCVCVSVCVCVCVCVWENNWEDGLPNPTSEDVLILGNSEKKRRKWTYVESGRNWKSASFFFLKKKTLAVHLEIFWPRKTSSLRFGNNFPMPLCRVGKIKIKTKTKQWLNNASLVNEIQK